MDITSKPHTRLMMGNYLHRDVVAGLSIGFMVLKDPLEVPLLPRLSIRVGSSERRLVMWGNPVLIGPQHCTTWLEEAPDGKNR
ncbi:hypothetical protein SUGI_1225540 [Cryptomeria japonica]|uniref:Uncharacterized protein n=1 Tax=Cryptomeria japonica TaxID=3369 RepID=A0AAD3NP04_CRYJA|nr:hypothetical protein SUGI_1225540 [Cryptomeria japonica]